MKISIAIALLVISTTSYAATLSFLSFRITVGDDWIHSTENRVNADNDWGDLITFYHPDGFGVLKIQSYAAPKLVSEEILRNMTNVDSSIPLRWQDWGDYSGYQYDYLERGSFYRQWWLSNARTTIFITYQSDIASRGLEIDRINRIVNSITMN